jgi:hypothetical protein
MQARGKLDVDSNLRKNRVKRIGEGVAGLIAVAPRLRLRHQ